MELRHLRYFVAVAEELHFGRAAQRLNVSQPPLSMQIAGLERELGLKLLDRDKRNVALTKAGEAFLHRARTILSSADEAAHEARRIDRGYDGKLTIGYMSAVMLIRLAEFLQRFRQLSPSAEIDLRQMRSNEQYMAVINGEIDVGFVDIAVGSMASAIEAADLSIAHAFRERLILCVAKDHPLGDRTSIKMCELAGESFVTLHRQTFPSFFDRFMNLCHRAGFNPDIGWQVESMPAVLAMAAAGYGVALVPELGRVGMRFNQARFIAIEDEAYVDIYMISRNANRGGLVRRLIDLCIDADVK
ncbi:MAG TPA: LysR substrate-binding domain-containing protein [Rhizorhapis sp.]|nr:LysR substrate-binding domain-containing protein [Rhizorhapis sp.]